jgi:glutamate synthase (NADPH/NADH) small chain
MTAGQRPELVEKKVLREYGPCDMALLALGFTGPENIKRSTRFRNSMRTNYKATNYQTNVPHFHRWRYEKRSVLIVWATLKAVKREKSIII